MHDLKRGVELAKLLLQPGKEVEDDTCLDRILSGAAKLLHSATSKDGTIPFIEELLEALSSIVGELCVHHTVSAHGYLIQLLSHILASALPNHHNFESVVTFILTYPDKHMHQERLCEENYSLASSWLSAIKNLIPVWEYIVDLSETSQACQHVIAMTRSPSMFVRRNAVQCLAAVIIKLHEMNNDVGVVYRQFSLNSDSAMSCLLELGHAMLRFSYSNGIQILALQELSASLSKNRHELSELCGRCDPVLCHFIESFYCNSNYKCFKDIRGKVISPYETLWCATTCISHHPTKAVGWKILMSLVNNGEPSQERDIAMSLVTSSLKSWKYSVIAEKASQCHILDCCDVLTTRKHNMPAMGRIFCYILNAIGCLDYTTPVNLKDSVVYVVQSISASFNHDPSCYDVTARIFLESSNATIALLGCLSRICIHLTANEQNNIHKFLLDLMAKSSTHHTVIESCYKVVKLLLRHSYKRDFLIECVCVSNRLFVDRRWEVRDSALQFFSTLLPVLNDVEKNDLLNLCDEYHICNECIRLTNDSNAFVRAAAITLLGDVVTSRQICDYDKILETILKTMNDTDIFPRRKAVTSLVNYLKNAKEFLTLLHKAETGDPTLTNSQLDSDSTLTASHLDILKATRSIVHQSLFEDLDWEVKYNSLGILCLLLEHDLQNDTIPSSQLVSLLHKMEDDYDNAVKEKAKEIATTYGIINGSLKTRATELQTKSELSALLAEVLTSLKDDTNNDVALPHTEHSVILDCY